MCLALWDGSVLGPGGWIGYTKLMFSLGAILMIAFLTVRFWLPRITGAGNQLSKRIRVMARFPLEPRKTLYVVGVGKQFMLMACSEAGVQFLTRLAPSDWNEEQSSNFEAGPPERNFVSLIFSRKANRKD
jgi:flagellar biogenesis protein FliO